jgi:cobalamin biosynthesis Co2+ chelatase CbiK
MTKPKSKKAVIGGSIGVSWKAVREKRIVSIQEEIASQQKNLSKAKGYLYNNILHPRVSDKGPMFFARKDGTIVAWLQGYTIVPTDEYYVVKRRPKKAVAK